MNDFFSGRNAIIASMHGKELVIKPLLESLGMKVMESSAFDTDQFGTFSGEIERVDDPVATLRKKCIHANELFQIDVVVASEGSFGPHPYIPFSVADEEFLMLKDFRNDFEIVVKELSMETNFDALDVNSLSELLHFASKVGFPEHALILKTDNSIEKGIKNIETLQSLFSQLQKNSRSITVETDMRAMNNPSRMRVIERAANKLKRAIQSCCPECDMPDFNVKEFSDGLPCALCGQATKSIRSSIKICSFCHFRLELPVEKLLEDPMYCNYCNP